MADIPIAKRLKEARLAANISQKKLGIAAGMDQFVASARMNQYERGKHIPDFSTLKRIATALGVPVAYFYADDDVIADLILKYNKLSRPEQTKVHKYLNEMYLR